MVFASFLSGITGLAGRRPTGARRETADQKPGTRRILYGRRTTWKNLTRKAGRLEILVLAFEPAGRLDRGAVNRISSSALEIPQRPAPFLLAMKAVQ